MDLNSLFYLGKYNAATGVAALVFRIFLYLIVPHKMLKFLMLSNKKNRLTEVYF